jgi:plasmid stabilization system protein ParE
VNALRRADAPVANFILSERAVEDVDVIHTYICADNPEAADRVQEAIFDAFALLARNPALGRTRSFHRRNLRSWAVTDFTNYIIFYRKLADGEASRSSVSFTARAISKSCSTNDLFRKNGLCFVTQGSLFAAFVFGAFGQLQCAR